MDAMSAGRAILERQMIKSTKVAPPYSLLAILDPNGGQAPDPVRGAQILSTPSCITVACFMSQDGETKVALGPDREVDTGRVAAFDGMLETPNRAVVVSTVECEIVLELPVPNTRTRVRIWVNRPKEPDDVVIGLDCS
jgi:hypothetical protein